MNKLDIIKSEVKFVLANPVMYPQPICVPKLVKIVSDKTPVIDVEIRDAVRRLVVEDKMFICSGDKGFYIPRNLDEFIEGRDWLMYRINPLWERIKVLEGLAREQFGYKLNVSQGELF